MSLMAENPVINSFHIEGGQVTKEDLRIYSMKITSKSYVNVLSRSESCKEKSASSKMAFILREDVIIACIFNKKRKSVRKMKLKTKELTTCALFAALIAVGAFIKTDIPLPMYTMHFTLQWFLC